MILKPLYLLILSLYGYQVYGQYRYVDLRTTINAPSPNDIVFDGQTLKVKFTIVNQGPDSLVSDDSLSYGLSAEFTRGDRRHIPIGRTVAPGDSIQFSDTMKIVGGEGDERLTFGFNSRPLAFSNFNSDRPLTIETLEDRHDNGYSVLLRYRLLSTERSVQYKSLILYPNPCSKGKLTLELDRKHQVNVEVVSVTGEVLLARQSIHSGDFIDVQNLKSGLYLVRIKDEEGFVATRKLLIP